MAAHARLKDLNPMMLMSIFSVMKRLRFASALKIVKGLPLQRHNDRSYTL